MKNKEYQRILKEDLFDPIFELTEKKAHDYASEGDTLQNFKRVGKRVGMVASEVAWFFICVKIERLNNLKGKKPKNESVLDTIRDLINYIGLYYGCLIEEQRKQKRRRKQKRSKK